MDQYFTYEARLASFQKNSKKRGSTANGRAKTLSWPHKQIAPATLAKAGFYFNPYPENPDNCVCFLCGKGLDGWEAGDDPLQEHLKHASACGWAIVAAIESDIEEYAKQDPNLPHMVEARKATFAGKWPHEGRKGWKCKTKQLVEAGWKYTPTEESDDMATCVYCQLALDGWEPSDKPYFFALLKQFGGMKKKATRVKAVRGSKASRLSVQSVVTAASDIASVADMTAEPEDSVLTTTSALGQGGKKTASRKKKAATTKAASKTKSKKSQVVEEEEEEEEEEDNESVHEELPVKSKATKSARGKKRENDAMDDSVIFLSEAPALKKQATASLGTVQMGSSTITAEDVESVTAPKATGRASSSSAKSNRKPSGSVASLRAAPEDFPDDEEIERQLEAELDKFTTDDEMAHDSASERSMAKNKTTKATAAAVKSQDYAMFDPAEIKADDEALDEELRNLQAEMEVDEPKQELHVPKKGRKAGTGTRKASKQTRARKAKVPSPPRELEPEPEPEPEPKAKPETEMIEPPVEEDKNEEIIGSTDTVVKNTEPVPSPPAKKPRERAAKSSLASNASTKLADAPAKKGRGRPGKAAASSSPPANSPASVVEKLGDLESEIHEDVDEMEAATAPLPKHSSPVGSPVGQDLSCQVVSEARLVAEPPSTPTKVISPAPSARQPALSPSQSPQSSDAENQPPSSVPVANAKTRRVVLAPVAASPMRDSPSKRNMLAAGLQSQTPWTVVDLDAVLETAGVMADKENAVSRLLKQGTGLSSPEKLMTVEEWIYFNAGEAEKKLKHECEAMVTRFEQEGTRAINVLEDLPVE
ncbi:hypothetical protein EsDP_00005229 [Epichloe bromicola]|uniref:Protein bir1 n=1 Tax=Epichloe bromicola TaxID=79588 RepID=A0ABQ0CU62_9HYPO